jgi:hypothetical protein
MAKRKMHDVLWEAANTYLPYNDDFNHRRWSCNSALAAEFEGYENPRNRRAAATDKFLKSLGCATGGLKGKFQNYPEGPERQGVRYMWLMLAAAVAKDEGVTL